MNRIIIFIILLLVTGCNNIDNKVIKNDEISNVNAVAIEHNTKDENNIKDDKTIKEHDQNETQNNELSDETKDDKLDFANFIIDKLVDSLKDENYDNLFQLYIYPKYGDQDINSNEMISKLLNNYKSKLDIETITYIYTGEIINYKEAKDVNYYKYKLYDTHGNQHYVEIGVTSNIAVINDLMFNPK